MNEKNIRELELKIHELTTDYAVLKSNFNNLEGAFDDMKEDINKLGERIEEKFGQQLGMPSRLS